MGELLFVLPMKNCILSFATLALVVARMQYTPIWVRDEREVGLRVGNKINQVSTSMVLVGLSSKFMKLAAPIPCVL